MAFYAATMAESLGSRLQWGWLCEGSSRADYVARGCPAFCLEYYAGSSRMDDFGDVKALGQADSEQMLAALLVRGKSATYHRLRRIVEGKDGVTRHKASGATMMEGYKQTVSFSDPVWYL